MLTRRTATVTISAPAASWACAITANEEYLPVPTISRDVNVRPAMTRGSEVAMGSASLGMLSPRRGAAADEVDDFNFITLSDDGGVEQGAPHHHKVVLDRNPPAVNGQPGQQSRYGHRAVELIRFAVEGDGHEPGRIPRRFRVRS